MFALLEPGPAVLAVVTGTAIGWLGRRLPGQPLGTPATRSIEVVLSLARATVASGVAAGVVMVPAIGGARPLVVGFVAACVHLVVDGGLLVEILARTEQQGRGEILFASVLPALRVEGTAITYGVVLTLAATEAAVPSVVLLVGVGVALAVAVQTSSSDTARAQHAALLHLSTATSDMADPAALAHRVRHAVADLVHATDVQVRDYPAMPGEIDVALPLPDRAAWLVASGRQGLVRQFTQQDRELLISAGPVVAAALRRVEEHAGMATLADTDALTGLLNRRALESAAFTRLARDRRLGLGTAVLVLDLDGFKAVNDVLGHDAGDRVLVRVAGRLRRGARRDDLIARLGGDEFAVVAGGLPDTDVRDDVVARLRRSLEGLAEGDMPVGVSIGGAVAPADGRRLDDLLRIADRRMYDDKPSHDAPSVSE